MGINKDPSYSAKNTVVGRREEELLAFASEHDKDLRHRMIEEVNSKGYYIEYLFQLSWMDKDDYEYINPIIIKYSLLFDCKLDKYGLLSYLGVKGNNDVTDFLLEQFRQQNDYIENRDWNFSRRGVCSSALEVIKDKSKIDEYIRLVEDENTRPDCFLIIVLLGELKVKKSIPLIISLLEEDNWIIQAAAIQALYYFRKDVDLHPILEPFLNSDYDAIRDNARRALK